MRFLSHKVEINPQWETYSQLPHSATNIKYLGLNHEGWYKLQLNARFNNSGKMAGAIESVCIDMANPDEDSDNEPKYFDYTRDESGQTIEIAVQDLEDFMKRISVCKCITSDDAQLITSKIKELEKQLSAIISLNHQDLTISTDHEKSADSCVY